MAAMKMTMTSLERATTVVDAIWNKAPLVGLAKSE